jgi:hypothetical protein
MRSLLIGLLFGVSGLLPSGFEARAETANTRIATMDFAECLSIIGEVSQ